MADDRSREGAGRQVTDFINATGTTTTTTTVSGLPAIAGNMFNIIASEDDARDWDPRVGVYFFLPYGGPDDVKWQSLWKFGNSGVIGTHGFPIVPQEPWAIWAMSCPVIVANSTNSTAAFLHTMAAYYNFELHNTTDWIPKFYPNVVWLVVRDLVQLFAGPDIQYAMDNPLHWAEIKDFIRRTTNYGRRVLRSAPSQFLTQLHPYAPMIRDKVLSIMDAAAPFVGGEAAAMQN